jgi:hemerythrin-like domain-containing protein
MNQPAAENPAESTAAVHASPDLIASRRVSRRRLLLTAGGGLIVGAGGTETADRLDRERSSPDVTTPGETLMYEHGVLKRVLLVYDNATGRAATDPALAADAIHDGATIIHDFIENFHEALEEGYVFPALKNAGRHVSLINTLLLQHGRGRLITQYLLEAATARTLATATGRQPVTDAIQAFIRMYQPHEAREDTIIFPAFRALLTLDQLDDYGATFTRLQTQQFGPDGFTDTVTHVATIENTLGINNLAQFTPPPIS